MRRNTRYRLLRLFTIFLLILSFLPYAILPVFSREPPAILAKEEVILPIEEVSCALCFFGLPRSFGLFVLPSITENILKPNKKNRCDVYFHYYDVKEEQKNDRSGSGGQIDVQAVEKLREAMKELYGSDPNQPHVAIISDTESDFLTKRGQLLEKYRTVKGKDGKYIYFPWMAKSFVYPTSIDNIVKQWHSIDAVFREMEAGAKKWHKDYRQVAMLRNDVMYMTPFDIYNVNSTQRGVDGAYVGVPAWARFPINDRMIYGSYNGVKIWSTERFQRLEDHVLTYEPGYGMHSERFLNHSIFPAIRELGMDVVENPDICFFRARADGSVWINDCATRNGAARGFRKKDTQRLVEKLIGKTCRKSKFNRITIQLHCDEEAPLNG